MTPMTNKLSPGQLKRFITVARYAAQKGGERALHYFRKGVPIIKKVDRSPVTRADREAEVVIRGILGKAFPHHQLCGEEFGWDKSFSPDFKWWIDPVDGTLQFIRGLPFWGTLLGLEYKGEVVAGVIHHPAISLTLWAGKGLGCYVNGKKTHVSKISKIQNGTLTYGGIRRIAKERYGKKMLNLLKTCYDDRGFGDCFGHSLVIQGMTEAMVDPIVKPYDVAPIKICLEEAGGKFSDLKGKKTLHGGNALSSNGLVHNQILRVTR
jgi:histidinol phosphatase-like enzyme (inositol monophosphatase family)